MTMTDQNLATLQPADYWNARARKFAGDGQGLRAVCSYGMPEFYNRWIDLCQRLALNPFLRIDPGSRVLDVGCGIGRWSRLLAARSTRVLGVDHSASMIAEARRRTDAERFPGCSFEVADVARLDLGRPFDLILSVTVLQHILDRERLAAAADGLVGHLGPEGRLVLLEAAPSRPSPRCDSPVFSARGADFYIRLFESRGLRLRQCRGVDPMPLKTRFLPHYSRLPRALANAVLAAVTAASLPVDLCFGRWMPAASWHKVMVFAKERRS